MMSKSHCGITGRKVPVACGGISRAAQASALPARRGQQGRVVLQLKPTCAWIADLRSTHRSAAHITSWHSLSPPSSPSMLLSYALVQSSLPKLGTLRIPPANMLPALCTFHRTPPIALNISSQPTSLVLYPGPSLAGWPWPPRQHPVTPKPNSPGPSSQQANRTHPSTPHPDKLHLPTLVEGAPVRSVTLSQVAWFPSSNHTQHSHRPHNPRTPSSRGTAIVRPYIQPTTVSVTRAQQARYIINKWTRPIAGTSRFVRPGSQTGSHEACALHRHYVY